jgi:hypothetical protein
MEFGEEPTLSKIEVSCVLNFVSVYDKGFGVQAVNTVMKLNLSRMLFTTQQAISPSKSV